MYKVVVCLFLSFFTIQLSGTTIVPFKNLGLMAINSQEVVYVEVVDKENRLEIGYYREYAVLKIMDSYHGRLAVGSTIAIKNLHKWNESIETMIWGDLNLEVNTRYLLFLQQNEWGEWQPTMLSYGALQEVEKQGQALFTPFDLGTEVHIVKTTTGENAEPLKVYRRDALLQHLQSIIIGETDWDQEKVLAEPPLQEEVLQERMAAPSHCTYLGDPAPYPRWDGFPTALPAYYATGGDPGCASSITQIQSAISNMNANYSGLNMTDGGTHSYVPTCSGMNGATGSEFTTFVDNNYGQRSITIQFEDPCSEITDLSGCSGVLAIGGLYWFSSTHTWDGMPWNNAAYGYVVVNIGVGPCICSSGSAYEILITHEMTHSLGFGHISTSDGAANMNPNCCINISSLDIECLDYTYLSALPVELINFSGKMEDDQVALEWQTASEINNEKFIVERAGNKGKFSAIGTLQGAGNAFSTNHYYFDDKSPLPGVNYYRLKQVDFDGSEEFSDQIVVDNFKGLEARVFPNPAGDEGNQLMLVAEKSQEVQISVLSLDGVILFTEKEFVKRGTNNIPLLQNDWLPGVYFIKLETASQRKVIRMMVK